MTNISLHIDFQVYGALNVIKTRLAENLVFYHIAETFHKGNCYSSIENGFVWFLSSHSRRERCSHTYVGSQAIPTDECQPSVACTMDLVVAVHKITIGERPNSEHVTKLAVQ